MSTARFNTLQNAAGSKSVPVDTVVDGSAKAWVNFNGIGTVAIRAAFNVSSVTDLALGKYRVNFSTAISDTNYAVVMGARPVSGLYGWLALENNSPNKTTSAVDVTGMQYNNTTADVEDAYVAIFR